MEEGQQGGEELNIHRKPQILPAFENREIQKHGGGKYQKKQLRSWFLWRRGQGGRGGELLVNN